ncbi:MAG: hypothetical protein JOZ07_01180 [Solirubrobacterales bacterium]|nr:hypothetical protein [Solirubrobacterales bacterium]
MHRHGEGVDADLVDQRLGALGVAPPSAGQRGLFGRGLRDVWLAQGAGRIEGIRDRQTVESWFFPAPGDDPYAFCHVIDRPASAQDREALGVAVSGTRVTVPLIAGRLPAPGRLRTIVAGLVQLRPILRDPAREVVLELEGRTPELVTYAAPDPDPERPVLFDDEVKVMAGVTARMVVRRSVEALSQGFSRATRRGGLVVCSGRAAHETTLASCEGRPGARHLYGEVVCEAIEDLQRAALEKPRPELVVRVDRSGLNEHHPLVTALYQAVDRVLRPIVAAEERRAGAHLIGAPKAISARDQVGLRALNELLRSAFDQPGSTGTEPGDQPAATPAAEGAADDVDETPDPEVDEVVDGREPTVGEAAEPEPPTPPARALWFKQSPVRLHPGERRTVTLLADPAQVPPGTMVEADSDAGLNVTLRTDTIPMPARHGACAIGVTVRARVSVEPGSRLTVVAAAGAHAAELEVLIVRHRASGWVREIARKDQDQLIEAEFDAETGMVTVYEGRREFRALERAARRAGYTKKRAPEYVPFRMLEVEAAANAVYAWAAEQVLARRLPEERPADPAEYAAAVRAEHQALRHTAHHKLMHAFLEDEIFDGQVHLAKPARQSRGRQLRLVDDADR